MGLSLLWFFQLLAEWVLQLQSHIQKTGISPGHKALTTVQRYHGIAQMQDQLFEVLALPLVTCLPLLVSQTVPLTLSPGNHGPNVLETLLFCTKFLFSCSLKHFQVQFYINFVSAGHHFSYKMFLVKSKIGQRLRLCQLIASPRNNKPRQPTPSIKHLHLRHYHSTVCWQPLQNCLLEATVLSVLSVYVCILLISLHFDRAAPAQLATPLSQDGMSPP